MKKILVIFISMISLVLWACKKGNENFNSTTTLFNASIGMTPISIFLNGSAVIANDSFGVFKTNSNISASTYRVAFVKYATGGTADTLYSTITSFPSGNTYTAIFYDSASHPVLYYNPDNYPTTVTDGKCSIRFFNLIPNSTAIYLVNDTGTNTAGKVFLTARKFADFGSNNAFVEYDTTTTTNIKILNDTATYASDSIRVVRFDSTSVKLATYSKGLQSGKIYSMYLTGTINGSGALVPTLIVKQYN